MASDQSQAPDDDPEPPKRPRRKWDGDSWLEPHTFRRNPRGQWARKRGNEPSSQLVLPGFERGAA